MSRLLIAALALVPACAQIPRVGAVETYGLRRTSEDRFRKALRLESGDRLPASKGDVEDRLEQLPNVVAARLEAICCENGAATLFVGIEEKGAPAFDFHTIPAGAALLPDSLVESYRAYLGEVEAAARRGSSAEDLTAGHALMADPAVRARQQQFLAFAKDNLKLLREVLRTSSDEEHRAIAAAVIGYAPRKKEVVDDLQYAMRDSEEAVRANAMRALGAIAVLAIREPDPDLKVAPIWFVEMLNSLVLSDRHRAAAALVTLSEKRDPALLDLIRERALDAVAEMARWQTLKYAAPPFVLLGRIAGLDDKAIEAAFADADRPRRIDDLVKAIRKK